jgi:fructosamine-3-kinase
MMKFDYAFVSSSRIGPEMFEGEALGLKAMYDTKSIRVPLPYKVREVADARIYIAAYMEHINTHDGSTYIAMQKPPVLAIYAVS